MRRKWMISLPLCILLLLCMLMPVTAAQPKVVDKAGVLTSEQQTELETAAQKLADTYGIDVVILTVDSLEGASSQAYADDYFDENDYGLGPDSSGVLLLLAIGSRDWAISTCGEGISALTDDDISRIFSSISSYLAEDRYYRAFDRYLEELEKDLRNYSAGDPGNGSPSKGPALSFFQVLISLGLGAAAGGITLLCLRSQMNTAKAQHGAASYLQEGSYALHRRQDIFLFSSMSKTPRAESHSSGGGRGGGSSVHTSSSGRSHGGGHGKF